MTQTRIQSMIESVTNIAVGIGVSFALNIYALPLWGFTPSIEQATEIAALFTVTSLARSYILRRIFNRRAR